MVSVASGNENLPDHAGFAACGIEWLRVSPSMSDWRGFDTAGRAASMQVARAADAK
jgi:hypothetical protein